MAGAETIVAINKDSNAPIFDFCDLGVVGDVHQVLPRLTELVRAQRAACSPRRRKAAAGVLIRGIFKPPVRGLRIEHVSAISFMLKIVTTPTGICRSGR